MAINIKSMKGAIAGTASAIPPGWNYSAMRDGYDGPNGEYISKMDIAVEGSFSNAFMKKYGATSGSNQMASAPGANGPAGPYSVVANSSGPNPPSNPSFGDLWNDDVSGKMYIFTQKGWVDTTANAAMTGGSVRATISSAGNLTVGNPNPPTSVIAIETKVGRVGINIETGDITIPPGIGRDVAAREFWLGFQEHFKPANTAKYEQEIKYLKRDLAATKASAVLMKQEGEKDANKRVAEKVRQKYGNEKFIMLKPEDLIRFIEEA
jgi:hypothetical protein